MAGEDRVALADLFNRYAEALDRKRWAQLEEVFCEDVETVWPGGISVGGRADSIAFIRGFLDTESVRTHHMLGNFSATLDGERAEASVYCRSVHQGTGEKEGILDESLGLFAGKARRTAAGWCFARLELEVLVKLRSGDIFGGSP